MTAEPSHPFAEPHFAGPSRRDRRAVALPSHATRLDGSIVDLTLLDLSYDGCGVDCRVPLTVGEVLSLSVHGRGVVNATVRWSRGGKAGLCFARTTGPTFQPAAPVARRHKRIEVDGQVTLRRPGKLNFNVRLFDLTPHGCKAEVVERPNLNEQVWVKFDGIEAIEAEVCWIADTKVGLWFSHPIHPAVFDVIVTRLRAR